MRENKMKGLFLSFLLLILVTAGCGPGSTNGNSGDNQGNSKGNGENAKGENAKGENAKQGGELSIAYASDIVNFDPILSASGSDMSHLHLIYDTLVNYSPNLEALPGLAESWEQQDEKTLILNLQAGAQFHDGTPFDAEAVKFNLERVISEGSVVTDLASLESVEVIDPLTVALHLKLPDSGIVLALTDKAGMMVSPTAVEEYGDEFSLSPVGSGPFKMTSHVPGGEVQYERFDQYWQEGKPKLDKIIVKIMVEDNTRINALKSGEVQVAAPLNPSNIQAMKQTPGIKSVIERSQSHKLIFLNTDLPPLDKKEVRLAIQYALDRDALTKSLTFGEGEPAYQQFPEAHPAYNEDNKISHDPEKVKQLLKEAGVENITLDIITQSDAYNVRITEAVKGQLEQVGINVNIHPSEVNKLVQEFFVDLKYHGSISSWGGRADPYSNAKLLFGESSYYNSGKHSNPNLESLLQESAATYDMDKRIELIKEISRIVMWEDALSIPIFFNPNLVAMEENVNGYESNLVGRMKFESLWLEQ